MIESITREDITPSRSGRTFLIGLAIALAITAGVGVGMIALQRRTAARLAAQEKSAKPVAVSKPTPELQFFMDEAQVKSGQAALTGTVRNISPNTIAGISVDFQLFQRQGDGVEVRTLATVPTDLAPNSEAKYQFSVPQKEFRTLRVLRVRSSAGGREIAFVTEPGAKRPSEGPGSITTTVNNKSQQNSKGEIFINTPDNPQRVP